MSDLLRRVDSMQRRWKVPAFAWAVQKKFGDDRGGYLCALITYYGFISVFPLLLAAFTVVAYVLSGNHSAISTLEDHVAGYPIIGPAAAQLKGKSLEGSPLALIVGLLGLIWGAQGLAQVAQHAMAEVWNVPNKSRLGFVSRTIRTFTWYTVFGIGAVISTFVSSIGTWMGWAGGPVLSTLAAVVFDAGLFVVTFWLVLPPGVSRRDVVPSGVVAGMVWAILTGVGVGLVHLLNHTNSLYGTFAPILFLLAFIYLMARICIMSLEANVVATRSLWPRALLNEDLTEADLRQLDNLAGKEERIKPETVNARIDGKPISEQSGTAPRP